MSEPIGLRERKKQQTRQLIAETARGLFTERGFDHVAVAEIARAAEVAEQTVYNYFPTKEDLVYGGSSPSRRRCWTRSASALQANRHSRPSGAGCCARAGCWTNSRSARA